MAADCCIAACSAVPATKVSAIWATTPDRFLAAAAYLLARTDMLKIGEST